MNCNDYGKGALLDQENTLMVDRQLASEIGLNITIFIQQLHYWIKINQKADNNFRDGHYWVYNTYGDWVDKNFPFWSKSTLKRIVKKAEKRNIIHTTDEYNKMSFDSTKWYTINYNKIREVEKNIKPKGQDEQPGGQDEQPGGSKWNDGGCQSDPNNTKDLPKTNSNNIYGLWDDKMKTMIPANQKQTLNSYLDELPMEVIKVAMQRTKDNCSKKGYFPYCKKILDNWVEEGVQELSDIDKLDDKHNGKVQEKPKRESDKRKSDYTVEDLEGLWDD